MAATLFASSGVRHWDFPRGPASAALLVGYGRERGASAADLLHGSGLSARQLDDPALTIGARQELAIVRNLQRLYPAPGLGFDVGARYHVGTFGIFGYACLTSPTLGDAARFAVRHYELSFGFSLPTVTVEGRTATLRLDLPELTGPVAEFLLERDMTAIASVMSDLVGGAVPFESVRFGFPARGRGQRPRVLGKAPRYGADATTATFAAAQLRRALPQANPITVAMCESQCRELVNRRRKRTGVAEQVREHLVTVDGTPRTLANVARAMAMSERTLRRRLAAENTTFRQLFDEVHRALAEEMLATRALSVDDVAVRLGYAEASSFIAAFKRWTGTTPARYQRRAASAS
jgi:AraC-like DNA-binding protein